MYLGADTPVDSVVDAARSAEPAFVVISSVGGRPFRRHGVELARLAGHYRLCLGGAGATNARLDANVVALTGGPVGEAERLTELARQ